MVRAFIIINLFFCFWMTSANAYASSINLSKEELAWIEKNRTIRISGPQAFPPFQYIDKDGAFSGMASDYIYLIAKMAGLEIEVIKNFPWPEILKKVENKEIDLLTCAAKAPEREKYLVFLKPHLSFPLVIISRKDAPFISGLQSLNKKNIAMVRKNSIFDWLQRDQINFNPHFVDSPLDALKAVSLGDADASIENLAAATYLIEKNGLTNLKIAAPTSYENYDLSIAVRKDMPELAGIFNKGLAAIDQDKHNEIRQKWIAVRYEYGISARDIIKWVLAVCFAASLPLAIFYRWNRKLTKEIQKRIQVEVEKEKLIHDLTTAIDEIKTLRGILPLCSFCKRIRDDSGYWEQVDVYIRKYSQADISHSICPDCMKENYPILLSDGKTSEA